MVRLRTCRHANPRSGDLKAARQPVELHPYAAPFLAGVDPGHGLHAASLILGRIVLNDRDRDLGLPHPCLRANLLRR
jgi:hypothetical protein